MKFINTFLVLFFCLITIGLLFGCIESPKVCTEEAKICPDSSVVVRTLPDCEFTPCPIIDSNANYSSKEDSIINFLDTILMKEYQPKDYNFIRNFDLDTNSFYYRVFWGDFNKSETLQAIIWDINDEYVGQVVFSGQLPANKFTDVPHKKREVIENIFVLEDIFPESELVFSPRDAMYYYGETDNFCLEAKKYGGIECPIETSRKYLRKSNFTDYNLCSGSMASIITVFVRGNSKKSCQYKDYPEGINIAQSPKNCIVNFFYHNSFIDSLTLKEFMITLEKQNSNLIVNKYNIGETDENFEFYQNFVKLYDNEPTIAPATFIEDKAFSGFIQENGNLEFNNEAGYYKGHMNQIELAIKNCLSKYD